MNKFEFGPVVQETLFRHWFKDISYQEPWQPLCSTEQNHLCNFGKGHYEEYFYEIIFNLDQWFRRCHLKHFSSRAPAALMFSGLE